MKRFMLSALGLIFISLTWAAAADEPVSAPAKTPPPKVGAIRTSPPKIVRMRATGIVVEISGTMVKIDRIVKENREFMEFVLEKPFPSVKVGDHITVSYITKNGGNVAVYIYPVKKYTIPAHQKTGPKEAKKTPEKPSPENEATSMKK